jgi:hypothetical protein
MLKDHKNNIFRATVVILLSFQSISFAQPNTDQLFDYADYAAVLKTFVDENAMVNYSRLKGQPQQLKAYVSAIGKLERSHYEQWGKKDQIAFWLNAYNGLTLKVIIDNYPIKSSFFKSRIYPKNSIRQISGVWDKITFKVMGRNLTLEHIEHKILRPTFNEPGIHMAMVCAAMGCPPLRNEPYTGDKLDEQLDDQARRFLGHSAKFKIDRRKDRLYLSPIFKWFAADFVKRHAPTRNIGGHNKEASSVLSYIAPYLSEANKKYVLAGKYKIKYLDYDWSLNEQRTRN